MVIYVQEAYATIQKRGEGLEVRKQGKLLYRVPFSELDRLAVVGMAQVTTQAMLAMARNGIDIVYMSHSGRVHCTMNASRTDNVFLRLAQVRRVNDPAYRLAFAKNIVRAKIASQMRMVQSHRWSDASVGRDFVSKLETLRESAQSQVDVDRLRGIEGSASRVYFSAFSQRMTRMPFTHRSRRPAKDPANALLNLGYAFLGNECGAMLEANGLDCGLGFMHGVVYGRKSLTLDIIEAFRVDVVDRLILRLCNLGIIAESGFTEDAKTGFRLSPAGFSAFVQQYEQHVTRGERPLRRVMREEADKLRSALLEGNLFTPWEGDE